MRFVLSVIGRTTGTGVPIAAGSRASSLATAGGTRVLRKLCMIAAAIVIPVGVIAASGDTVAAKVVPPVDATNYTVSCTVFSGGLKFKPALRSDFSLITAKVKATLAGCTAKPN